LRYAVAPPRVVPADTGTIRGESKPFNPGELNPKVRPPPSATTKPREDFVIYVVATLTIKLETRAELIAAAKTVIGITRKEKGCILYDLHESMTDPARFVFVEQWETMEDLMAHGGNEHMKPWRKVVKECMTAPTKIEIITPEKVDVR
jgi:quinol monooxygenase YgiN